MNKILLPNLICALLLMTVQNVSADNKNENSSVNAVVSLAHYLPESCYQTGRYTQQKSIAGINKILETEGSFAFACDKGLLWHTAQPLNETLLYQLQGGTQLIDADGNRQKLTGTVQRHLGQMLNNLLGGNSAYLEKSFVIAATEKGIQLTPRKKRMEKFIRNIHITRAGDTVAIRMQHQGEEFTAIRVFALLPLPSLNAVQCAELLAGNDSVALACQQLLAP